MNRYLILTRLFLKVVFILAPVISVHAQRAWQPGYIIQQNNDTLKGFIEIYASEKTPVKVGYKQGETAEKQNFKPSQIKGFAYNDKHFWSAYVQMEKTPFYDKRISDTPGLELFSDSVFAEQLIKGKKQLFKVFNTDGKLHFYIGKPDSLVLLEYKLYEANTETKPYIAENRKFCGQLNYYLADCQDVYDRLLF